MNYFKNLYDKYKEKKRRALWLEVPMDCNSRVEKDIIIFNTIETLEQSINIIKN
jgi:hypothetical protein